MLSAALVAGIITPAQWAQAEDAKSGPRRRRRSRAPLDEGHPGSRLPHQPGLRGIREEETTLLEWALPSHGQLYEVNLGHRGDVAIALSALWMDADGSRRLAFVSHPAVQLEELSGATLRGSLERSIDRSAGLLHERARVLTLAPRRSSDRRRCWVKGRGTKRPRPSHRRQTIPPEWRRAVLRPVLDERREQIARLERCCLRMASGEGPQACASVRECIYGQAHPHAGRQFDGVASGHETRRAGVPAASAFGSPRSRSRAELLHVLMLQDFDC